MHHGGKIPTCLASFNESAFAVLNRSELCTFLEATTYMQCQRTIGACHIQWPNGRMQRFFDAEIDVTFGDSPRLSGAIRERGKDQLDLEMDHEA